MNWVNLLHFYQPPYQKKKIIDQVWQESYSKILSILEKNSQIRISLNICGSLTEQLAKYGYDNFLKKIKILAEKGQIELVGSACYHAFLPLLPQKEIIRQIKLNEEVNQKYLGSVYKPRGFFSPEMAYSKKIVSLVKSLGYQWIALDEIAYQGEFNKVNENKKYFIKEFCFKIKKNKLKVIFRNRGLSLLFFGHALDSAEKFFSLIRKKYSSKEFLITAFDGENLGHHQENLINIWERILQNPEVKTFTYSEYLKKIKKIEKIKPLASTWSTEKEDLENLNPYPLWHDPKNKIHQWQWQITNIILREIESLKDNANYKIARNFLDQALASDQYWWASKRPWWSPGMITKGLNFFLKVIEFVKEDIPLKERQKIKELSKNILREIKD